MTLPEKIFTVEYSGFFDFTENGLYDLSVINRDDYANAEQIAIEMAKRYNHHKELVEALEACQAILNTLGYPDTVANIETILQKVK
jgi:hypothetical protein